MSIAPGSAISFDIYVADFRINLHDRFSMEQDPVADPSAAGAASLGRFSNTAGVEVLWDGNELIATLGYDHTATIYMEDEAQNVSSTTGDSIQHLLSASVTAIPVSELFVGVRGNAASTTFEGALRPDVFSAGAGVFLQYQLSANTSIGGDIGYRVFSFDDSPEPVLGTGAESDRENADGFYGILRISNRFNRFYTHSLSAGSDTQLSSFAGVLRSDFVRYNANWTVSPRYVLTMAAAYEWNTESGALVSEDSTRLLLESSLSRIFSPKIRGSIYYRFARREADLAGRGYVQNVIGLQMSYAF